MEYIDIKIIPVTQKGVTFYVGKINCLDLLQIYTVHPLKYDLEKQKSLKLNFPDDAEYFNNLIERNQAKIFENEKKGFQRDPDFARANQIAKFLNETEYALFPNAIIASCDLINDLPEFDDANPQPIEMLSSPHNISYLDEKNGLLRIPKIDDALLVIDGQHRIEGLKRAEDEVQKGYELLVSFILGADRSVISKLFYTINYTQQSVNKSVLYHLTGEFSTELDVISFLHEMVKVLNESDSSPFHRRIKMLGKSDYTLPAEQRSKMTVSQAFLIDYLKYTVVRSANRKRILPIFAPYFKFGTGYLVVRFIMRYFMAIRQLMPDAWDNPSNSVLSKTVGVGAFLKLMNYVFIKLAIDTGIPSNPELLDNIRVKDIAEQLGGIENIGWDQYSRGGSAGQLNKLKDELIHSVAAFRDVDTNSFLDWFSKQYATEFDEWVLRNS